MSLDNDSGVFVALAGHFAKARDTSKAVQYFLIAAKQSERLHAHAEAHVVFSHVPHCERAAFARCHRLVWAC